MEIIRIGDKVINRERIQRTVSQILEMRAKGYSQQDVANELNIDRTFVSRLESLGEIRKGGRIALIAFPIANKVEIEEAAAREGVDYTLVMTDSERWEFVEDKTGIELFNQVMKLVSRVKDFDLVVFLGSDMRIRLAEAILGRDNVVGIEIGKSPIKGDVHIEVDYLVNILRGLRV